MNKPPPNKSTLLASTCTVDAQLALVGAGNIGTRLPSPKLRVPEAATFCGCSISKLNKHRVTGDGPPFIRCGRLVSYDIHDLEAWLAQGKRRSTSEQPRDFAAAPRPLR
jgi:predicted DNA-binding transcriptional regulator AlpA